MKTLWLPREGFVKHSRRLSVESPSQRLCDGFTKASRRDHYGDFMKPSFEAFVNPSDEVHIGFGIQSNCSGLLEPSRPRFVGVPLLFLQNYAVQRGNGYDLPDNADKYRSGGRADKVNS